jgi:hypothetical protein
MPRLARRQRARQQGKRKKTRPPRPAPETQVGQPNPASRANADPKRTGTTRPNHPPEPPYPTQEGQPNPAALPTPDRNGKGPPNPTRHPTAATQRRRHPNPAHHPTDRNQNLAITPGIRPAVKPKNAAPTRSKGSWPVLPALPDPQLPCSWCCCVKGAEGIAERRDEGAPLTRHHQPLRQMNRSGRADPVSRRTRPQPQPQHRPPRTKPTRSQARVISSIPGQPGQISHQPRSTNEPQPAGIPPISSLFDLGQ